MNGFPFRLIFSALVLSLFVLGCSDDEDSPAPVASDYSELLENYSQDVVLATYAQLRDRAAVLQTAVASSNNSPASQPLLEAAAQAWVEAREPWEQSEAFLFGPVAVMGLDPSLDSWPVDEQQLAEVLASDFELDADFVANGLGATLRGFHTTEYLLFRDGQPRDANAITVREREYLTAVCEVLHSDAQTLWEEWESSYAAEFSSAGEMGSRYNSQDAALEEMIDGMAAICDEVANGKIANPFDEQDPQLVESQFSWNSLDDFADNIRGVRNALYGQAGVGAATDHSLYELISERDAALAARLETEIETAITRIGQIPHPFRNNLTATAEITAAQAAIQTVMNTLSGDVKSVVLN